MKLSIVLIFVGIALIFSGSEGVDICDSDSNSIRYCPPDGQPDYDECCRYFKDTCCTHEENERLKTIFIVVIVVSVLSFIGLVACVIGIIACCVCSATRTPTTTRTVVQSTGYAPMPSNVVVANTTNNTMMSRPM